MSTQLESRVDAPFAQAVAALHSAPAPLPAAAGRAQRILVVDDSPTELAVLSALFHNEGFQVVPARDGEEALEKLAGERFRMVLLDVVMPGENGFSLCRQIRANGEFGRVPIIMLTSKNQPSDRFWGLKQGATEYLTKPWNAADLLQTVRRHL